MELGISTLPFFGASTLEEAIDRCAAYGFRKIEIMCEGPQANPEDFSPQRRADLVRRAEDLGVQYLIHAPIADINLMSHNTGIRAEAQRQLIEAIRFTSEIQAKRMVFHVGGKPYMGLYDFEQGYIHGIAALEKVVQAAETYGVKLLMENDPNKFGLGAITVDACKRFLEAYPGRLGFLLDVGHAFMLGDDAVESFCREFGSVLGGVHFSDNHRERDEHLGLGKGAMNVGETVKALKQANYSGEAILEVKSEEDIASSVRCLNAFL